jgi:transcriptional regulator with XRE-family HTH domain
MNERIKEVRNSLKLTLEKFGEPIGLKKSGLSLIENGKNALTEQNIKAICRVYNVNEHWLRTGEGEMFLQKTIDEELSEFVGELIMDQSESFKKRLISALTKLRPEQWDLLEEIIDTVNDMKKE